MTSYPDASTTGPAAGGYTTLTPETGQVITSDSIPSWCVQQEDGSYLIEGLAITGALDIDLAGGVAITGCQIIVGGGGDTSGVILRETGWTIRYCEIAAPDDGPADRISTAVQDLAGGGTLDHCNIYWCRQCFGTGSDNVTVTDNYFHDLVFETGDHSENIYFGGGQSGLTVTGNTLLNPLDQTACVFMDNSEDGLYDGVTISANYIAGGSYALYLGVAKGGTVENLVVENNTLGTDYYPGVGSTGVVTDNPDWGADGNVWSANVVGGLVSGTVTATQGGAATAGMAVVLKVVTGAALAQPGAVASVLSATPSDTLTPQASGSWVYGAILEAGTAALSELADTTFEQSVTGNGLGYYALRSASATTGGTPATYGASGTVHGISTVLCEILAAGTLAEDASSPAVSGFVNSEEFTTAAFTPPAGSLLVLMTSANGDTGTTTMSVTDTLGLGLTWTEQAKANGSSSGYSGVWTAQIPAASASGGGASPVAALIAAGACG